MLNEPKTGDVKAYVPKQDVKDYLQKWYKAYQEDRTLKDQYYRRLGNTTLSKFWQIGDDNYDVIVPVRNKGDWKRNAKRTITRDKADGFISKLVKRVIASQVIAQNKNQEIDLEASRIFGILLTWWDRISRSTRVYVDAIHTAVVQGTVHVGQTVRNGREQREIWPNKEIYIPNFKQPDLQKQSHLIRAHITTYEEAKLIFGKSDQWKYVQPGSPDSWAIEDEYYNEYNSGVTQEDQVLIIYLWEHTGYDKNDKPKQKLCNVLIQGVNMHDIDNKQNLKHKCYPCSKTIFAKFADAVWYWGNSLPNKVREDQRYLDAFRTILLNKALINLLKPLMNKGGEHIDDDLIVPAKVTPTQTSKDDIYVIEGIADPITSNDIAIEQLVEREVDEGTQPPASLGQNTKGQQTLGEIQLKDARASELLETFGRSASFLAEDMGLQSLSNIVQFEVKKNIQRLVNKAGILFQKTIEVGDQALRGGEMGFASLKFTPQDQQPTPDEIAKEEFDFKKKTGKNKNISHIDPKYIEELDKFIYVEGNPMEKPNKVTQALLNLQRYKEVYYNNPNIVQKEATRTIVRDADDDEDRLLQDQQPAPEAARPASGGAAPRKVAMTKTQTQAV